MWSSEGTRAVMARPIRVGYEPAVSHATARGNERRGAETGSDADDDTTDGRE